MDLVVIGSPSGLHAEQGIAAAQQGLHVLTEKPIDTSTARVDRLIAEAARAGVTLGVIFQDRMKPDIRAPEGADRRRTPRHADSCVGERALAPAAATTTRDRHGAARRRSTAAAR